MEKKYDKIETDLLTNFDYQLYTSKDQEQRTSKIYKGKTAKGKKIKCQVLHVANSLPELEDIIKRKRIKILKLRQSIFESSASSLDSTSVCAEVESNIITGKRKRKRDKKVQNNIQSEVQDKIIDDFLHNASSETTVVSEIELTEEKTTNDYTHIQNLQDRIQNMEKEITDLKERYNKQKEKADLYYTKYKSLKQSGNFPFTEKAGRDISLVNKYTDTEEKQINQPTQKEAETISVGGIRIKKIALEMAFLSTDPSKFVIILCYSIWGYKQLATRCVKKIAKKDEIQIVTPKKVETLRQVFKDWLMKNGYQNQAYINELKHMKVYIRRAITGARRHLKLDVPNESDVFEEAHAEKVDNEENQD